MRKLVLQSLHLGNNALGGQIPLSITSLTNLGASWFVSLVLDCNKLTTSEPAVIAFLNQKDPDWAQTQTVPPTDLQGTAISSTSAQLTWTPILYTADGGFYEASYAMSPGGPYMVHGTTGDKRATGYLAANLMPGTTCYFVVRTFTPAHGEQQNALWSDYSQEVTVTVATRGIVALPLVSTR